MPSLSNNGEISDETLIMSAAAAAMAIQPPATTTTTSATTTATTTAHSSSSATLTQQAPAVSSSTRGITYYTQFLFELKDELMQSTDCIFQSRITWLLLLGPMAIVGDSLGLAGEEICFLLSGIALIPCAERLSFVTEEISKHTNGTFGALLNATFGNAPELLISVAALRSGFYRVVQLAMLGSMITNMIFVFGISCLIGGLRYQVQELRLTSGNVSVMMLLVSTAGSLIPATLILSGQFSRHGRRHLLETSSFQSLRDIRDDDDAITPDGFEMPTQEEVTLSRVNAAVMLILYLCYLLFQLGTHADEFHDDGPVAAPAKPNVFCRKLGYRLWHRKNPHTAQQEETSASGRGAGMLLSPSPRAAKRKLSTSPRYEDAMRRTLELNIASDYDGDYYDSENDEEMNLITSTPSSPLESSIHNGGVHRFLETMDSTHYSDNGLDLSETSNGEQQRLARRRMMSKSGQNLSPRKIKNSLALRRMKLSSRKLASVSRDEGDNDDDEGMGDDDKNHHKSEPVFSMRVGIVWLFIITLCISAMTDILVDTIDGFAQKLQISQVFTSMVIIPFFSNVAEQVSAILFAYRNEMDLCIGVTIGSAIQIATFVLPMAVLFGFFMDRAMTLYFHSYETACLFFCTVVVAAVLQNGTSNWLVGTVLVGIYVMFAAGIWFHETENLSIDTETLLTPSNAFDDGGPPD